jgi:hypothetical protein
VIGRPKERFCKRGHDTQEAGRIPSNGWCRACSQFSQNTGGVGKKKPSRYSLEWERSRVKRWLEITTEDPLDKRGGTQERMREFGARYERLEADVPTPVDV